LKRRRIAKERAFVPLLGFGYDAALDTAFEEPKNLPFWFLKTEQARLASTIATFTVPGFTKPPQARFGIENLPD